MTGRRIALVGAVLLAIGGIAVAVGILPAAVVGELAARVWPILLFVVAMTVVTELAEAAGVFRVVAAELARFALGRTWVLWLLTVLLATVVTVFLSLDTTALLLTPVFVVLARHIGVRVLPFAMTTVVLANTGSLLLPVSNLTNLLAEHRLDLDPGGFAALMALPATIAVLVPAGILALRYRRDLVGRFTPEVVEPPADRVLFTVNAIVLVLLLPALVSGVEVWIPAVVAAVVLLVAAAFRQREVVRWRLVPGALIVFACGLFLVVAAAESLGLSSALQTVVGTGDGPLDLARRALAAAASANLVDNLPAYLALEPTASTPAQTAALLVGVNAGPLVTPWASLAVLLWHDRLTAMREPVPWREFLIVGVLVAPVTVLLAALALGL